MIRWTILALATLTFSGCTTQAAPGPEAAVTAIYAPLVRSKGDTGTQVADIPMTEELALMIQEVESQADGAVFDFDLAGLCQDCSGFSGLELGAPEELQLTPAPGHTVVQARFTISGNEQKAVYWDMTETDGAWKVDNIISDDFNLREIAAEMMAAGEDPDDSDEPDRAAQSP